MSETSATMEQLKFDSHHALVTKPDNIEVLYSWMDYGDVLSEKMRNGRLLLATDTSLITNLKSIVSSVMLINDIVLYRGMTCEFNKKDFPFWPIMYANQFTSLSPNINTATDYGGNVMEVLIPRSSHAFYISAWENFNLDINPSDEKEILVLPGVFNCIGHENNVYKFLFKEN